MFAKNTPKMVMECHKYQPRVLQISVTNAKDGGNQTPEMSGMGKLVVDIKEASCGTG